MKKYLVSVAVLATMVASCTDEKIEREIGKGELFTLVVNQGPESRTELGDDKKTTNWSAGDRIYVTSEDGKTTGVLSLVDGVGENEGTFSGYIFGADVKSLKYIVYPVPEDGKVGVGGIKKNRLDVPMIGQLGNANAQAKLSNVGGMVKMTIDCEASQEVLIGAKVGSKNVSSGYYDFDCSEGTMTFVPGNSIYSVNLNEGENVIYLPVATEGTKQNAEEVQVSLIPIVDDQPDDTEKKEISVKVAQNFISSDNVPNISLKEDGKIDAGIVVTTAEELENALSNQENAGRDIKLGCDIKMTSTLNVNNCILDGNKKTLKSDGQYIIYPGKDGVTIKNLIIDGENKIATNEEIKRGIYCSKSKKCGNIVIEDVVIKGTVYTMNLYGEANATLSVNDSELNGWTSYTGFGSSTFTNCRFIIGSFYDRDSENDVYNKMFRPYKSVELIGCTFDEGFILSTEEIVEPESFVLKNCKVGETLITKNNLKELLNIDGGENKINIINDVTEMKKD